MPKLVWSIWLLLIPSAIANPQWAPDLGKRAIQLTEKILAVGPRPVGSRALQKVRTLVSKKLTAGGLTIKTSDFSAATPIGTIAMQNLIGILPGKSHRILLLACHLDSKKLPNFVGANDSASACALILAMLPEIKQRYWQHTLWLTFFDGEEAIKSWSREDSLYGSRSLATELKATNLIMDIRALILLDMIGDQNLEVADELNSSSELKDRVRAITGKLKLTKQFFQYRTAVEDDHLPFAELGVPVIDLIDFRYPHFHKPEDTIDKLAASSLQMIGDVVWQLLLELDNEPVQ